MSSSSSVSSKLAEATCKMAAHVSQHEKICTKYCRYCRFLFAASQKEWQDSKPAFDISNATSEQTSPLLALPPEIKNMIYRLILSRTSDHEGRIHPLHAGERRHCRCDNCSRSQDALLLTCRSVYNDAVGMTYSQATLSFADETSFLKFMHCTGPRRREGIQSIVLPLPVHATIHGFMQSLRPAQELPNLVRLEADVPASRLLALRANTSSHARADTMELYDQVSFTLKIKWASASEQLSRSLSVQKTIRENCELLGMQAIADSDGQLSFAVPFAKESARMPDAHLIFEPS